MCSNVFFFTCLAINLDAVQQELLKLSNVHDFVLHRLGAVYGKGCSSLALLALGSSYHLASLGWHGDAPFRSNLRHTEALVTLSLKGAHALRGEDIDLQPASESAGR